MLRGALRQAADDLGHFVPAEGEVDGLAALRSGESADSPLQALAELLNSSVAELRSSALEGVARIGRALAQDHDGALDGAAGVLAPFVVLLGTPIALATKERIVLGSYERNLRKSLVKELKELLS